MSRPKPALRVATSLALLAGVMSGALVTAAPASAAPTPIFNESFQGATVDDPAWGALDSACLTMSTASGRNTTAGESNLGGCTSREDAPSVSDDPGYLQLTDNDGSQVGGAVYNRAIPANGGVSVTFDQWQYSNDDPFENAGADGIGFFLVDGSTNLTRAGGVGGALGYSNSQGIGGAAGVTNGYIGIGLDAFGNFSNDSDAGGNGCGPEQQGPGEQPNTVALRGPGSGRMGYCYLAGTRLSEIPGAPMLRGTTLGNSRRTVRVTVSPANPPLVTVEMDFDGGIDNLVEVLRKQMTEEAPSTFKLGFAASTGGQSDVHLIRNTQVQSVETLRQLNLVKEVDSSSPLAKPVYNAGDRIPYRYTLTNTGSRPLTALAVSPSGDRTNCPTELGAGATPTATASCTGTHVLTAAETRSGTYDGASTATASDGGLTPVESNSATAPVTVTPAPQPPTNPPAPQATPTTTELEVAADGLSAEVTPSANRGAVTGEVGFYADDELIDTADVTVVDGVATATSDRTVEPGSPVEFTATYLGNSTYARSSDTYDRVDPTITARIVTDEEPNAAGWYNQPVEVRFRCSAGSAPIVGNCPRPVTRRNTNPAKVFARSISATDGGGDTAEVPIKVDVRGPVLTITQREGAPYARNAKPITCVAEDGRSGVRGECVVTYGRVITGERGEQRRTWKATAIDVAGNRSVRRKSFWIR